MPQKHLEDSDRAAYRLAQVGFGVIDHAVEHENDAAPAIAMGDQPRRTRPVQPALHFMASIHDGPMHAT